MKPFANRAHRERHAPEPDRALLQQAEALPKACKTIQHDHTELYWLRPQRLSRPLVQAPCRQALMKLQPWADHLIYMTDGHERQPTDPAMNGNKMHAVKRDVHEACKTAFYGHTATDQVAHQTSDG